MGRTAAFRPDRACTRGRPTPAGSALRWPGQAAVALSWALLCSGAPRAEASAWNRAAGTGLAIVDATLGGGTEYYDGRGRLAPARAYDKGEASAYVEYGATDALTLLARPSFDRVRVAAPDAGSYTGLGSTAVGAQWQALVFGPAVLAVQGTFGLPGSTSRTNPALAGNTSREAEGRLLGGVGLPLPFRPFVELQGAYRVRSGGAPAQWHCDATAGVYPIDRLLLLAQSFTVASAARGPDPRSRATKVGLKGVYALTQAWALQLGVFTTRWGRQALRERGVSAGVWYTF